MLKSKGTLLTFARYYTSLIAQGCERRYISKKAVLFNSVAELKSC